MLLPVALRPLKSPLCVPRKEFNTATRSPSAKIAAIGSVRSGNAARSPAKYFLRVSRPGLCPAQMIVVTLRDDLVQDLEVAAFDGVEETTDECFVLFYLGRHTALLYCHVRNTGVEPDFVLRSPVASKRCFSSRIFRSAAASVSAEVWTECEPRCSGYRCGTADPRTKVAPFSLSNVIGASLFSKTARSPFNRISPTLRAPLLSATQAIV